MKKSSKSEGIAPSGGAESGARSTALPSEVVHLLAAWSALPLEMRAKIQAIARKFRTAT